MFIDRLKARIYELEIFNEDLTGLYNKHMKWWAEREKAQDVLLDELFQSFSELLDNAIEERLQTFGEFRGGPEKYYQEDIALRDRIRQELGKKGE